MAFSDWIARTFYGADELQAESDRLDRRRQELNQSRSYRYGDDWYQDTLRNDSLSRIDAVGQIGAEFTAPALQRNLVESTVAASDSVRGWLNSVGNAPLSFVLRSIPWWGWVGLVGFVFWWAGGPMLVRGFLARRGYG